MLLVHDIRIGPRLAPSQQAIAYLQAHAGDGYLVTHHDVNLLRQALPELGMIDAYYAGDATGPVAGGELALGIPQSAGKSLSGQPMRRIPRTSAG